MIEVKNVTKTYGTGIPAIKNNVQEKLQLLSATDDYLMWLKENQPVTFVPEINIRNAINTLYPFGVTDEEKKVFEEMVKNNPKFPVIRHVYSKEDVSSTNDTSSISTNEIEDDLTM